MRTEPKELLVKMGYFNELIRLVNKQPFTGTSATILYEALWSVEYIDSLTDIAYESNVKESLTLCKDTLNNFINTIDISKVNYDCDDEVQLLQLKYGNLDICSVEGPTKLSLGFSDTFVRLIAWLSFAVILVVISKRAKSFFIMEETIQLSKIFDKFLIAAVVLGIGVLFLNIAISLIYVTTPLSRGFIPERLVNCIKAVPSRIYNRELRNVKWLDFMHKDKQWCDKVAGMLYELANYKGLDRFHVLVLIEFYYMKFLVDKHIEFGEECATKECQK